MAATIATATGRDNGRVKVTHRLGSQSATGEAATWRTFARVTVERDGSGHVLISRDGSTFHAYTFGPEDAGVPVKIEITPRGRQSIARQFGPESADDGLTNSEREWLDTLARDARAVVESAE